MSESQPPHFSTPTVAADKPVVAFDAGYCAALDTPFIALHDEKIIHPLKEVDAAAMAWATTAEQVVEILKYVTSKE